MRRRAARLGWGLIAVLLWSSPAAAETKLDLAERWEKPRRVTLKAKRIRVDKAVAKIAKQADMPVTVRAHAGKLIAVDIGNLTVFEALDEIAQRAGLAVTGHPSARSGLTLLEQPPEMKRMAPVYAGPVRVALLGIYSSRYAQRRFSPAATLSMGASHNVWVEMSCMLQPGLEGAQLTEVLIERATDEGDRSLLEKASRPMGVQWNSTFRVSLKVEGRGSLKIQELRGRAVAQLPVEIDELRLGAGARNITRKLGNAKFTLHRVERKGSSAQLMASLSGDPRFDAPPDQRSTLDRLAIHTTPHRDSVPLAGMVAIHVLDRKGRYLSGRRSWFFDDLIGSRVARFSLGGTPSKIYVRAVTRVRTKEIHFRFRDVPIPR